MICFVSFVYNRRFTLMVIIKYKKKASKGNLFDAFFEFILFGRVVFLFYLLQNCQQIIIRFTYGVNHHIFIG